MPPPKGMKRCRVWHMNVENTDLVDGAKYGHAGDTCNCPVYEHKEQVKTQVKVEKEATPKEKKIDIEIPDAIEVKISNQGFTQVMNKVTNTVKKKGKQLR